MKDGLIQRLCRQHHIELFDYAVGWKEGETPSYGIEMSSCTLGRSKHWAPKIYLGVYQDPELRLISFFHELGHVLDSDNKRCPAYEDLPYYHFCEASAWRMGLRLATRAEILFSDNAISWGKKQLATYFEDDHPERTPLKFLPEALSYAFNDPRREWEQGLLLSRLKRGNTLPVVVA